MSRRSTKQRHAGARRRAVYEAGRRALAVEMALDPSARVFRVATLFWSGGSTFSTPMHVSPDTEVEVILGDR